MEKSKWQVLVSFAIELCCCRVCGHSFRHRIASLCSFFQENAIFLPFPQGAAFWHIFRPIGGFHRGV